MDIGLIISDLPARCSAGIVLLMRRLVRLAATVMRKICLAVLQALIFTVVFTVCAMGMMHYLGLPVQVPPEVMDTLESLGRLTKILS